MAKSELTAVVEPKCQRLADELGFELVDVALDKEDTGKYLRIYIDKEAGIDLNDSIVLRLGVEGILHITLTYNTDMTDNLDGQST